MSSSDKLSQWKLELAEAKFIDPQTEAASSSPSEVSTRRSKYR